MNTIDTGTVALVAEALQIEPAVTSLRLTVAEWATTPTWETMLVVTVGASGALDAFELEASTFEAFATAHPPDGAYTIVVDVELLAAVFHNAANR